jgi:uridine kinase
MTLDLKTFVKSALAFSIKGQWRAVLLVGGAGCVGKSSFALELRDHFITTIGCSTSVLDLDCYLLERKKRETTNNVVTGYNPAAYQLDLAVNDMRSLLQGDPVKVSPYDKVTSTRAPAIWLEPTEILIVEGVMALTAPLLEFKTLGLYMDAPPEILYTNRVARELALGFDRHRIEEKFAGLTADYTRFIQPQNKDAEVIVELGMNYQFSQVHARSTC